GDGVGALEGGLAAGAVGTAPRLGRHAVSVDGVHTPSWFSRFRWGRGRARRVRRRGRGRGRVRGLRPGRGRGRAGAAGCSARVRAVWRGGAVSAAVRASGAPPGLWWRVWWARGSSGAQGALRAAQGARGGSSARRWRGPRRSARGCRV